MKLVNFHYFYGLSKTLQNLNHIQPESTIVDNWPALYNAENALRAFLLNDLLPPEASRESGDALVKLLDTLTSNFARDEAITPQEINEIVNALRIFENVCEGEYRTKSVFALSKKGLYSLTQLAYHGEEMFSPAVHKLMPDMAQDLNDAGKCIAFEVPTAAAFHLFRATEAATKSYILAIRKAPVTEKEKNLGLGGYKKILDVLHVDSRVLTCLEQLIKLHRNPTIQPEVHVTNEEVRATLGMVESVIGIMAIDMQRREETPNISLDEFLPIHAKEEEDGKIAGEIQPTTIKASVTPKAVETRPKRGKSRR